MELMNGIISGWFMTAKARAQAVAKEPAEGIPLPEVDAVMTGATTATTDVMIVGKTVEGQCPLDPRTPDPPRSDSDRSPNLNLESKVTRGRLRPEGGRGASRAPAEVQPAPPLPKLGRGKATRPRSQPSQGACRPSHEPTSRISVFAWPSNRHSTSPRTCWTSTR